MRLSPLLLALLLVLSASAQEKKAPKEKEVPVVDGKEIVVPEGLNNKAYQGWVASLAKKYNGKPVRFVGRVETVVEEPAKKRVMMPLTVLFTDDAGKEKTVRVVALFPFVKGADLKKKYEPSDMNRVRHTLLIEGKAVVQAIGSTEPFSLAGCKVVEEK